MKKVGNIERLAFVTGGSGFVGGHLIQALVAQGWQVRALVRSEKAAESVAALGATPILGELTDQPVVSKAMAGSGVVFHVAALFKMWGKQKEFNAVNVEGTRTLVESAVATPSVWKVIMVSAAAVGQGDPEPQVNIDERAPFQQRSFAPYSASKAAAEQILLAANGRREGFQTVALRPALVWGAGMPMLDRMVEVVKAGTWQWPDGGTHPFSTCHITNLIDAVLLAVDRGHGAYFVADAEEGTLRSAISDLLATRGVKAGDKSVSFGVAWMLAGIMGFFWNLLNLKGEPPITRQMLRLIGKPFTLNIGKARRELGHAPRVSWKQGTAEMRSSL